MLDIITATVVNFCFMNKPFIYKLDVMTLLTYSIVFTKKDTRTYNTVSSAISRFIGNCFVPSHTVRATKFSSTHYFTSTSGDGQVSRILQQLRIYQLTELV